MKSRRVLWAVLSAGLTLPLIGQVATEADLAMERKANEERFKILEAKVQSILETQELLLKRTSRLEERVNTALRDLDRLTTESARTGTQWVSRDELKTVVDKLQEVDRKREEDKKLILSNIRDLAKLPAPVLSESKPSPEVKPTPDNVYEYKVGPGNTLIDIINAYNEDFEKRGLSKIDLDQVKKVNPTLNVDRIRVGQMIFIPIPPPKR